MFMFDRCRRSSAAVAPVKYECDLNNLRGTFTSSKILLTEKLANGALVTPTPGPLKHDTLYGEISRSLEVNIYMDLTHWDRDKMAAISQTMFSNAFSWMKMCEFCLRFDWNLFLRVQLTIFHHWLRQWLGADQTTSRYLNQWWLVYWRICASLGLNELK